MQFTEKPSVTRWVIIGISFLIVLAISWQTYVFFDKFKKEERAKMELWADSQRTINIADLETQDISLPSKIIQENKSIPIILVQGDSIVSHVNLTESESEIDKQALSHYLQTFKKQNEPIKMEIAPGTFQYLYYGNSKLLNQLAYYPIALITIILLFALLISYYYRTNKLSSQNKLWAGMAKETAHQIGTPLSSLIGWIEIMKADDVDETTVTEIEKDVVRLQTIADRFSKIGSEPALETRDIVAETKESYEYLKSRFTNINFSFKAPNHAIMVSFNPILHSWTIENLVKNAIDAMKGRGKLDVRISEDLKHVKIQVRDSGKGIAKSQFKKVFEPGFTTKKRGWGLGLSLTKRIVQDYHKGRIKVLSSEINRGTVMQASFPKQ